MLGPVQVVPPQGLAALRGLHLDRTCAPAVTWQLTKRTHEQDHLKSECPRFQGNPVSTIKDPATSNIARGWCRLTGLTPLLPGFTLERREDGPLLQLARLALIVAAPRPVRWAAGMARAPTPPWPEGPKSGRRRLGAQPLPGRPAR